VVKGYFMDDFTIFCVWLTPLMGRFHAIKNQRPFFSRPGSILAPCTQPHFILAQAPYPGMHYSLLAMPLIIFL
jgi:hypothetical protein